MTTPDHALRFTEQELSMLGKTADGLSAYMGKSVLAEIGMDEDAEWVIFAIPLGVDDTPDEKATHVQMGGPGARFVGNRGGLDLDTEVYDCQYLWAVQITDDPEARFVRLDQNGDEFDYAMDLAELLPFDLTDEALPDPDLELLEDLGDDDDDPDQAVQSDEPPRPPSIH
jgi:hypothetical protein